MSNKTQTYPSMSSISALQNRCRFDELNLPGRLLSLEAKNGGGTQETAAIYEILIDVDGTGDVTLDAGGNNSAWIKGFKTPISIN